MCTYLKFFIVNISILIQKKYVLLCGLKEVFLIFQNVYSIDNCIKIFQGWGGRK